jgi:predicted nucleotidyltransferase
MTRGHPVPLDSHLRALAAHRARVWLFGSRVRGAGGRSSDIDVALLPLEPLPADTFARIEEELENSQVLYPVDHNERLADEIFARLPARLAMMDSLLSAIGKRSRVRPTGAVESFIAPLLPHVGGGTLRATAGRPRKPLSGRPPPGAPLASAPFRRWTK